MQVGRCILGEEREPRRVQYVMHRSVFRSGRRGGSLAVTLTRLIV
jgi:hypothetical protein